MQGIVKAALRGADASQLVHAAVAKLQSLQSSLPPGVKVVPFYNRSSLIERAVATVQDALLEATVLVVILLLLFLGELVRRLGGGVDVLLPAALYTFLLMRWTGQSANLMSLGGLAIAIGMLVDAAVVVVENTVTRLEPQAGSAHLPHLHRVYAATREVATPVAAGMLIIVLTFLPLLTLEGLEGRIICARGNDHCVCLGASRSSCR